MGAVAIVNEHYDCNAEILESNIEARVASFTGPCFAEQRNQTLSVRQLRLRRFLGRVGSGRAVQ